MGDQLRARYNEEQIHRSPTVRCVHTGYCTAGCPVLTQAVCHTKHRAQLFETRKCWERRVREEKDVTVVQGSAVWLFRHKSIRV